MLSNDFMPRLLASILVGIFVAFMVLVLHFT